MNNNHSYNLASHYLINDDFLFSNGDGQWTAVTSGTASSFTSISESGHPGITRFGFGSAASSTVALFKGNNSLCFDCASFTNHNIVRFPTTGTVGGQNYKIYVGFMDGAIPNNGAYFLLNALGLDNSLVTVTVAAGLGLTQNTTSVVIDTGTWYKLSIDALSDGSRVDFFINNALVATHTTNIPTGTNTFGLGFYAKRTGGTTTNGVFDLDLSVTDIRLNTPLNL